MIGVEEAKNRVFESIFPLNKITILNRDALNKVLAEDIYSPLDLPPFQQSAMDGYAVKGNQNEPMKIIGEIKAGDAFNPTLKSGEAVRIFTGAPVPTSADAVIMQEHTKIHEEKLVITITELSGTHIRPIGEQIKKGKHALSKGTICTPAVIGFISSMGITHVEVYSQSRVAVLATGNELVPPGNTLNYGRIYESNALTLACAVHQTGVDYCKQYYVRDDFDSTRNLIMELLGSYDVLLVSGGISVGDYDMVGKALRNIGVEEIFYKVNQKPGKPLFFGKLKNKIVFGLPGNPAASLSCFYQYVYPALRKMMGFKDFTLKNIQLPLQQDYSKKGSRAHFLKGFATSNSVSVLSAQSSAMLSSFAQANAMIFIPEDVQSIKKGSLVDVYLLP